MGVAVGAKAVRGVKIAVGRAVDGVGLVFVVEANDVFVVQETAGKISTQPLTGRPLAVKMCAAVGALGGARRGQLALDVVRRVFPLSEEGGDDFPPCFQEAVVGLGRVRLISSWSLARLRLGTSGNMWCST